MKRAVHGTDKERREYFLFGKQTMQELRKEKKAKKKSSIKQGVLVVGADYDIGLKRFLDSGGDLSECPF